MDAAAEQARQLQQQREAVEWARNKPSLIVDVSLGLLFFIVGKATGDLSTAALVGAGAGLAVVVLQRVSWANPGRLAFSRLRPKNRFAIACCETGERAR